MSPVRPSRTVAYVPTAVDPAVWVPPITTYANARGLDLAVWARRWHTVTQLIVERLVDVVLVGTAAHLDPERVPRVEIVDQTILNPWGHLGRPLGQRRPVRQ